MKIVGFIACLFLAATFAQAVSVEQIGQLAELKTKDDLILELVQREGLDRPLTTDDVIVLREKGASEYVINYLLKLSSVNGSAASKQEGESVWIEKDLRAYRTRDKKGKPIVVVTNLDEKGKRMGPPPPPTPVEPYVPAEEARPVQEVLVTVRHEEPIPYDEEFIEEPEYVDSGIPLYGGVPVNSFPFIDPFPAPPVKPHCPPPNRPAGKFYSVRNHPSKPQPQPKFVQRSSSAGMATRRR